jgi:hypothetical protein
VAAAPNLSSANNEINATAGLESVPHPAMEPTQETANTDMLPQYNAPPHMHGDLTWQAQTMPPPPVAPSAYYSQPPVPFPNGLHEYAPPNTLADGPQSFTPNTFSGFHQQEQPPAPGSFAPGPFSGFQQPQSQLPQSETTPNDPALFPGTFNPFKASTPTQRTKQDLPVFTSNSPIPFATPGNIDINTSTTNNEDGTDI